MAKMTLIVNRTSKRDYSACLTVPGYITECHHASKPHLAAASIVKYAITREPSIVEFNSDFAGYSKTNRKARRTRRASKRS